MDLERVRTSSKRKATENATESAGKIVCEEEAKTSSISYTDIIHLKNSVYRERLKERPSLPRNPEDVFDALRQVALENYRISILLTDTEHQIVMLSDPDNLFHLARSAHVLGDGTFKCCPKFFLQLYTIHGYHSGRYTPCVYFLLPDKTKAPYMKMLSMLQQASSDLNSVLNPKEFHADLEASMHAALRSSWPASTIVVCNFHLGQAWFRKLKLLDCQLNKDTKLDVGRWLKLFFALPMLPAHEVADCFAFILITEQPEDPRAVKFADYIYEQYIAVECAYPPTVWTGLDVQEVTTTNACEAFHCHFEKNVKTPHPNIFRCLKAVEHEQEKTILKLRCAECPPMKKRKTIREKEEKRKHLVTQYRTGQIDQYEFLSKMSIKMLPPDL